MKKLNLNNSNAMETMQRKTSNAMKNLFAKVFFLVVMMGTLLPNTAWGQAWTQDGNGKWYIFNQTYTSPNEGTNIARYYAPNYTSPSTPIYSPVSTTGTMTYNAKESKFLGRYGKVRFFIDCGGKTYSDESYQETYNNVSKSFSVSSGNLNIQYGWESNPSHTLGEKKITVQIAVPVHCNSKTFSNKTFAPVSVLQSGATSDVTINTSDLFTSFLTANTSSGKITFDIPKVAGDDAAGTKTFYIGSETDEMTTPYQLCGANAAFQPTDAHDVPTSITFHFKPKSAGEKTATVTVKKDGDPIGTFTLTGNCTKGTPTINWIGEEYRYLNVEDRVSQPATTNSDGHLTFKSLDTNVIVALDNNDNTVEWGTILKAVGSGTATIQAHINETQTYVEGTGTDYQTQFEVTNKTAQQIVWSQTDINNIAIQRGETVTFNLTAKACVRGTETETLQPISYDVHGSSIASVQGNTLTVNGKGTITITATAAGDNDYTPATLDRTINIRYVGEQCGSTSIGLISEIKNDAIIPVTGLGDVLTVTVHWDWGTVDFSGLKITDSNGKILGEWSKYFEVSTDGHNESLTYSLDYGITSLSFSGTGGNRCFRNISATQKTYFTPENKSKMVFGNCAVGSESANPETFYIDYSNLTDPISVSFSGGDDSYFTIDNTFVNVGCSDFGKARFNIKFKPKAKGSHTETVTFTSKIGNNPKTHTIELTGNGTGIPHELSWQNPATFFADYNALTTVKNGNIDLTFAAKSDAYDNDNSLIATYELYNLSVDGMVEIVNANNKQYLKINKAGTFYIRAKQDGNTMYEKATDITYGPITVDLVDPDLHWVTTPSSSTEVFQIVTIGAATNDTQGEIGNITYSVSPASAGSVSGNQLTLKNCVEATLYATISETGTYSAKTIPSETFKPAKVTPNLNCTISSLNKTALTDLPLSEMPVTITNINQHWHDIAVSYSSSDESIAILDGNHFRLLKSGTCTITAKINEGNNNNASNVITVDLTVGKASQNIVWELSADEQKTHYAGDNITLTASCPSGNITYTSSNNNIATVNNGVLTFHSPGTVTITASSEGNDIYDVAAGVPQTFSAAMSDFSDTYIGQATTSQSIDLSPLAGATTLTLSSSNPTVFRAFTIDEAHASTALNNQLNISGASTVNVKFYPETTGEATGTITITDNNNNSINIPVKGTGVQQSVTFGSTGARIPRGTIESRTISLDNMVSNAGYTVTSNGQPFIVSQPQNGKFTIVFLPQNNTDISEYNVTIHDKAFGTTTTHDYKIKVEGHADAIETVDFGSVNARSTSSTTRQITLSGVDKVPGLKIASDENTSYLIDNNSSAITATDGQHTISFTPVHYGTYNGKDVYLYLADNPTTKYQLLKCNGVGNQVDLSEEINWVNTTISTQENTTGMAVINNTTYRSYVRLYYTNSGGFFDYNNHPTDLEIDKTEIFAPTAGVSTVTAHVEALDGSNDFIGESSAEITATDKPIQKISYSSNIYYVVLNDDVVVDVYAYDSKNPSTRIDADFTMTCADSKVTITKGNYDNTNYVQQFTIHGAAAGSTTVSITSTPKGTSSGYESATETGIPVTILANGNNCIVSVLNNPSNNTFNTSGPGEQKTFQLTGAPCRSFKATLNYKFGTPTLNISDGTNTLENRTYDSNISTSNTKTEYITYKYNAASKHKPRILTVNLTGTNGFFGIQEGTKELTITEFSQLSYFDVISNHPNGSDIDFRSVSVGSASVNETIKVDYSALHKAVELSLTDETNFTIVNKAEVLGKITNCGLWGELYIIVKYNPTVAGTHTATLTIKGYTTDDNNNESIKTYTYTLKGQSTKRTQIITWDNDNKYSIMYLVPERTLELKASSNQPVYGSTNPMPITYTFGNDGDGVATLTDGVLTIAKAGTITVIAHQAGDEYTEAATDVPLTITFTLEPQHIVWRNEDWSGNNGSDTKTIYTDALTSTGYELKILVQDSHGADLSHDPEFRIENEINCSGETDLIRIEKNANDNKFYAYYNNRGTGKVKITATHSGNASYSPMEEADEKSMYLVIEKRTPSITYNEDQLNDVYVGDRIDALTRPTTTIDFPAAIFNYDASTDISFSQNADAYVTLTKNDDNTTSLDAIHTTDGSIIYIHAKQQYNECYNDEATSGNIAFTVKKTPIAIEWNQTLDLSTGQYDENGAVYQLDGKVRDTRHDKIIDNLAIAYSLTISDKGCNDIPNDQIAKIEGNQLHVYGATSATLTITASQNGTTTDGYADYNAAENVQREFTIQKITPTITFEPQATMFYGDKVAVTATSAVEGLYQSQADDNNRISISSDNTNAINITNDGYMEAKSVAESVTLTASQGNNCMVSGVQSVPKYVAVSLAPQKMVWNGVSSTNIDVAGTQTFTFNPYPIDKLHKDENGTWLTLTTNGEFKTGNAVVYEIRDVTPCVNSTEDDLVSVDATTGEIRATGKGTGTVKIWAKANADSRYAEIMDDDDMVYVEVTIETVKPEIQSFDISSLNGIHYGDRVKLSSPTTNYSVNQGDNKTTFSYADNTAYDISAIGTDTMFDAKAAGTGYTITATQEAIACFNQASDAFTSSTFDIAKSEQEIEWNNQTTLSIDGVSNDYQTDGISLTAKAMDKRHKAGGSQTWLTNLETELPVTYTFTDVTVEKCGSDVDIISIDENGKLTATGLGSGTVTITATQADGNKNYSGITADEDKKSITVTVNKITPDLKIYDAEGSSLNGETLSVYYGDPEYTQLACQVTFAGTDNELKDASGNTLYSIDDIDLTDDGQGVVTINGNGISFNKAGVATITATLKADCRVSQDLTATFYVNVQKPAQEIKFEQDIENQTTLNYHNVALTAYSYDKVHSRKIEDLTVSYDISTSDGCGEIATYGNNTVHVTGLGAGTVTITASQAGDDRYGAAQDVQRTFTIDKETPTVDFTIAKVNGVDYSDETVIHYNDVLTLAGTSTVEGTSYDGHEHVTFKYNGEPISGNQVTVTDQQFTLQAVQAEDCIVNSGQSEVKNFQASLTPTEIRWNQTIADQTTTSPMQPMTLTAEVWDTQHNVKIDDATVTLSISGNETGCGDIATLSVENLLTVTGNGAGTVTLTASYSGESGKYDAATSVVKTFDIEKATTSLTWATEGDISAKYGETGKTAVATLDVTGTVTYVSNNTTVATIDDDGNITIEGVGTTQISATFEGDCQYLAATITKTLEVNKANQTIIWNDNFDETYDLFSKIQFNANTSVGDGDIYYTYTADDQNTCDDILGLDSEEHIAFDSEGDVIILAAGTVTITAHAKETDNYNSATCSSTKTIVIGLGSPNLSWGIDFKTSYNASETINLEATSSYESGAILYDIMNQDPSDCASLENNALSFTKAGIVTVMAYQEAEQCKTKRVEISQIIQIGSGPHVITWTADSYSYKNTDKNIDLSTLCTCETGNIIFTSSNPDYAEISGSFLTMKQKPTSEKVTITASVEGGTEYTSSSAPRVFTITVDLPTIIIAEGSSDAPIDLETTSPQVTSVTESEDFATVLKSKGAISCNYDEVTYSFSSLDDNIATFTDGVNIKAFKRSDKLGIQVTASVTGLASVTETLYVKIPRGTMIFNRDGNWHGILNDESNWQRRDLLPSADDHNVSIQANCTIDNTAIAECFDLTIENNGSLQVNADAVLNVAGTITNSVAANLRLKADASHSATVLFAGGSPDATVENYIQGGLSPEGVGENRKNNPDWQYRGFVGNNPSLSGWNVVIFKWDETLNSTNCWGEKPEYEKTGSYNGSPWVGYSMANYDDQNNPMYDYTSSLIPTTATDGIIHEYGLSYTDNGDYPNRGVNLITNSLSAPIYMSDQAVEFQGNVEQTFYFYKTRSYRDWESTKGNSFETIPLNTVDAVANSSTIASGQSFLIKVKGNGTDAKLIIKNNAFAHQSSGVMYAPAEKERFNVLSITMSIDTMADRLFLLESEKCSGAFDNGYDGTKIKESNTPQIFATNDFGHTAVNTDKTMLGQKIGYSANEDGAMCTITFNTDRLEGFSELYLYDRVAKRYTDILAGDSYSFSGTKNGEEERFEIVGRREDGSEFVTSGDKMIEVIGNLALLSGFADSNEQVFITDLSGKRLWTDRASNGPWFELPNLPAGVYLINCGEANCKFIVK